jgi:hypothetical protein
MSDTQREAGKMTSEDSCMIGTDLIFYHDDDDDDITVYFDGSRIHLLFLC